MRFKIFTLFVLFAIVMSACGKGAPATAPQPQAPAAPSEPQAPAAPAEPQAPAAPAEPQAPATESATLKIYLLDYTPDTIA